MLIKDYIQQACDYSYWANRRYLAVADGLTDDQLHRKQGHSWGDVHSVLVHMMSSESRWLSRWNGVSLKSHLDPTDFPTTAAIREAWSRIEAEMRDFLERQSEEDLLRPLAYTNFQGQPFTVPLWQMLMHVTNHGTHHRGELAAMFAIMNVPHPEEEVIQYFLDLSGQKKA
jgi:uncharacterized damage-inducible protein DinB